MCEFKQQELLYVSISTQIFSPNRIQIIGEEV